MTTLEKLKLALVKINEAKELIAQASNENESLEDYYGYSIELICNDLERQARPAKGYNTTVKTIIDAFGGDWH